MPSRRAPRGYDRSMILRPSPDAPPLPREAIALLPFQIGRFQLAIEAAMVVKILGPTPRANLDDTQGRRAVASLWEDFGGAFFGRHDSIMARGPETEDRVVFQVYSIGRLLQLPIERIAPLPGVIEQNIRVDYLWGTADHKGEVYLLLDPCALFRAARRGGAGG